MPEPPEKAVAIDRTSGTEEEGQDAAAQIAQVVHRARQAGFDVIASETDEDVKGDSPWENRSGLQRALAIARDAPAVLVVREPSRLWRGRPERGLALIETIPNLEVLGKSSWSRRRGAWRDDSIGAQIARFVDLVLANQEKANVIERTGAAMTELKEGRRQTRSGKPHHRPPWEPIPHALEAARRCFYEESGSQNDAVEAYRRASGYYDVKDPEARKKRDASRTVLVERLRALSPVGKRDLSERG